MVGRRSNKQPAQEQREEPTTQFIAPADPDDLIAWLERKREQGRKHQPLLQMKMNLAYVLGQQWIVWDDNHKRFRLPNNRSDDPNAPVRITANKMGTIVENHISRLVKSQPEPEARPVTDQDDDIDAARAATRILQAEQQRLKWEQWLIRHLFWVIIHGHAYAQITWNPTAGTAVGKLDDEAVYEGQIELDSVPAFEFVADPNALHLEDAKWAVRTRMMTKEAVWEEWGVVPDGAVAERSIAEEVYALIDFNRDHKPPREDTYAVHQFWMVPCRAAPKGLVVTWSGKSLLEDAKDFPYDHGRLPFVQCDLIPGVGTREGRTWVNDLIPLQADYNDARSREATIRRTLVPKVLTPTGGIDQRNLSTRVEVIEYNPGMEKPSILIPDSGWLAPSENAMTRAESEMNDRAGQMGSASGMRSAAAFMAWQEMQNEKLLVNQQLMADFIEGAAWMTLELVRQFWTEKRLVATWSEGVIAVDQFKGADIRNQLDVHVSSESGATRSKSAMVQLAMELWNSPRPVITDPRQLLRIIQMPGTAFLTDALNVDAQQAQRENEVLWSGEPVQVNIFDNDGVHITEHDNERKSAEYAKLMRKAEAGDQAALKAVTAFDAHVAMHHQMQASKAQQQQAAAQPPGAPGAPMPEVPGGPVGPQGVAQRAGIGGPAQPGAIPGMTPDEQAAAIGR